MRRELPALSEHRWLRFATFFGFYLVQGFPIGLISVAFPAWLIQRDIDKAAVASFVAITGLPWAFKLVAGPFMDRFAFPPMGIRRPWVMGAQTLLAAAGCSLFFLHDPHGQFWMLTVACTVMNALAAFQDVAVDGMAITVLKEDERGRANSFMVGGQVTGYSLTGAASVPLLNHYGIPAAGLLTAAAVGCIGMLALLFRERPGERLLPWTRGEAHPDAPKPLRDTPQLFRDVYRLLLLPMSILLVLVEGTYRALEGVSLVWWPDLAIKGFGYSDEQFAFWNSTGSIIAAAVGVPVGFLVDRIGARRGIFIGLLSNAVLYLVLWAAITHLREPHLAVAAMTAASIGSQWMFISTVSVFMNICGVKVAATQFAIYMALSNLARSGGAKIYPPVSEWFGTNGIFLFMAAGYLVALALLVPFNLERHRRRLAALGET